MDDLKLFVFRVGHGLCTLVQGKENGKSYNAVFDCGCQTLCLGKMCNGFDLSKEVIYRNLDEMVKLIKDNGNHLDLLVSSHQDEDHNSLILPLIAKLNEWKEENITKFSWVEKAEDQYIKLFSQDEKTIKTISKNEEYSYCINSDPRKLTVIFYEKSNKFTLNITNERIGFIEEDYIGQLRPPEEAFLLLIKITFKTTLFISSSKDLYSNSDLGIVITDTDLKKLNGSKKVDFVLSIQEKKSFSELKRTIRNFLGNSENLKEIEKKLKYDKEISEWIQQKLIGVVDAEMNNMYPGTDCIISPSEIKEIVSGRHLPRPKFYIKQVILGGYSYNINYETLKYFFKKYKKYFYAESPEMDIRRERSYKYYGFSFDKGLIEGEKIDNNNDKAKELQTLISEYLDTSDNAILFNETSTVVNFIYETSSGKVRSVLFPGDVTPHHQIEIGDRICSSGVQCGVVFLPHHGSFNTNILFIEDTKNEKIIENKIQPFCYMYNKISHTVENNDIVSIIGECFENSIHNLPRRECIDKITKFSQASKDVDMTLNCFYLVFPRKFQYVDYSLVYSGLSVYTTGCDIKENVFGLVFDLNANKIVPERFGKDYPHPPDNRVQENKPMPTRPRVLPPDNLFI